MLGQDFLTLRLFRLKPPQQWGQKREGYAFVFPKGGVGNYLAGQTAQRLVPGDVAILNECAGGRLHALNDAELVFCCFCLSLEHLFPLFASNEIPLLQSVSDGLHGLKLYPATSPLAIECHSLLATVPPQFNLDHRSHLLKVAAVILSEEFKTALRQRVGFVHVEEHLTQVFENLASDELLNLSVGELADKFGCSRRHLNRLFHQHFGLSVAALRMEMRLLKAVSLLRDPEAKVINVAGQCGFNHLGLFNICFKRRFGTSPGHWRRSITANERQGAVNTDKCLLHTNGLCPMSTRSPNETSAALESFPVSTAAHGPATALNSQPAKSVDPKFVAFQKKLEAGAQTQPITQLHL